MSYSGNSRNHRERRYWIKNMLEMQHVDQLLGLGTTFLLNPRVIKEKLTVSVECSKDHFYLCEGI
jgi:hypothetical protein